MSEKLPRVTAEEVIRVLEQIGFSLVRQSGSHKIYKNREGKRVTVPYHAGKILHPKLLKSILRDADLTVERFRELLSYHAKKATTCPKTRGRDVAVAMNPVKEIAGILLGKEGKGILKAHMVRRTSGTFVLMV